MVAELDGTRIIQDEITGVVDKPEQIGIKLAERLIEGGAGEILSRIYGKVIEDGAG
jgi:hydroxymethylbilane synthase